MAHQHVTPLPAQMHLYTPLSTLHHKTPRSPGHPHTPTPAVTNTDQLSGRMARRCHRQPAESRPLPLHTAQRRPNCRTLMFFAGHEDPVHATGAEG